MPDATLEVDLTAFDDEMRPPPGWGRGQPGVPNRDLAPMAELRAAWLEELKDLSSYRMGSAPKDKTYDSWKVRGTMQGRPELTDELVAFVRSDAPDPAQVSDGAQLAFLRFGHSWYAPPQAIVDMHEVCFGPLSTFRALCAYDRFVYDYDTHGLFERGTLDLDLAQHIARLPTKLFALRHTFACVEEATWQRARDHLDAHWQTVHPDLRPLAAFVLNDRELAEHSFADLQTHWYWNHTVNGALAVAPPEAGLPHAVRSQEFLPFTAALLREHGTAAVPLLVKLAEKSSFNGNDTGDSRVACALAATPHVATMAASLRFLGHKGHQRFIQERFAAQPSLGATVVREALAGRDAGLRAAARAVAALTDAADELCPSGRAATADELPPLLTSPPWTAKKKGLKLKPQTLPSVEAPVELSWLPNIEDHFWPKGAAAVKARLQGQTWWMTVSAHTLLQLDADGFALAVAHPERIDPSRRLADHAEAFGTDAVLSLVAGWSPAAAMPVLDVVGHARIAPTVASALGRKTVRDEARAWLDRYPEQAATGLAQQLFAKAKKPRNEAIAALCELFALGHGDTVLAVGARYAEAGAPAVQAAYQQLAQMEPTDILPAKIPKLAPFFTPISVDPPRLRDGAYVDGDAFAAFCTMLSLSTYDDEYPGVAIVAEAFTPASLEAFAHSAFETWLAMGGDAKHNWAMLALGWFGGDEAVRRLTPLIRRWPGQSAAKRAQIGLDVLAKIGSDNALSNVYSISQKLKYKSVQKRAGEVVQAIADGLGLTREELGDRVVPDFDLDADGTTTLDYGPRQFLVRLDEALTPQVFFDGKRLKTLPKPGKADDADLAKAAKKRFNALKKDLRTVAKQQLQRLELAMAHGRSWEPDVFRTCFLEHPLVLTLAQRLVWRVGTVGDGTFFAVDEEGRAIDPDFDPVELAGPITLPHPADPDMTPEVLGRFGEHLADFERLQPFEQLSRAVHTLEELDIAEGRLTGFGIETTAPGWVYPIEKQGWSRYEISDGGAFYAHDLEGPDGWYAVLFFEGAVGIGYIEDKEPVRVTHLSFSKSGEPTDPADVDPRFLSEVLRSIRLAAGG